MPANRNRKETPKTVGDLVTAAGTVTAKVVGDRIVAARKRRSMNQSDLARQANLSRSVLNGYEKGRHLPGAAELARICDALRATPNELLYGMAEPFAGDELKLETLQAGIAAAVLVQAIEPSERDAVLALLRSLAEFRQGKPANELLAEAIPAIAGQAMQALPGMIQALEKAPLTPEMQALIARRAADEKPATVQSPRRARKRRSAPRKR